MPEKLERVLYCDYPDCPNTGAAYKIDDGHRSYRVILCPDHDKGVREAARWGVPDSRGRARGSRGLSPERLDALKKD